MHGSTCVWGAWPRGARGAGRWWASTAVLTRLRRPTWMGRPGNGSAPIPCMGLSQKVPRHQACSSSSRVRARRRRAGAAHLVVGRGRLRPGSAAGTVTNCSDDEPPQERMPGQKFGRRLECKSQPETAQTGGTSLEPVETLVLWRPCCSESGSGQQTRLASIQMAVRELREQRGAPTKGGDLHTHTDNKRGCREWVTAGVIHLPRWR